VNSGFDTAAIELLLPTSHGEVKAPSLVDRRAALAAIAGVTPVGLGADAARTEQLRRDGLVAFPEDLGIAARQADRSLLAARSIGDLVAWSGGLYDPPAQFRDW
jgi:malonate decarboxylase alpha subunit